MKRLITLSLMLVALVAIMAGTVCAAPQTLNHGFFFAISPTSSGDVWSTALNIGPGLWNIDCSGGTTLTATTAAATLTGGWNDNVTNIWKFQVSNDGATWTDLQSLVAPSSATPPPVTTAVMFQQASSMNVSTSWIRIGYNANLAGANAVASGTAGMIATAVPEPSSAVALATGVVGIIGLLKRRRS